MGPYNPYGGTQSQGGMAGYGASPNQGYPGPPSAMPAVPGYGGWPAAGGLPPGWESKMEPSGRTVYIDHNTKVRLEAVHVATIHYDYRYSHVTFWRAAYCSFFRWHIVAIDAYLSLLRRVRKWST